MDIVETARLCANFYTPIDPRKVLLEAAGEIERLREALKTIAEEGSGWGQSVALAALKEGK